MKIIYCIAGTYNSGGMERILALKANYLVKQGMEVLILTSDQRSRKPYFDFDDRIQHLDLGINYDQNHSKGVAGKALTYLKLQRLHRKRLEKVLKRNQADVVISLFDHEANFLYDIRDGSKKILEVHFSRFKRIQYDRKGVWGWVDRWRSYNELKIARRYDRFVVLTQEDKQYWGSWPELRVIPNANSFEPILSAALTVKRVIAVGRLDYQKDFEQLIRIWDQVFKAHPDWMLSVFGQGPQKNALQQLIDQLGLQAVVHIQEPVKEIDQEYLKSSILVLTSRYEGLPMVLLEGQACGLPMVAYACQCGPRDIIHHGENGFLIKPGDQKTFAQRLVQLIDDPELRKLMGRRARVLSSDYSLDNVMGQWLDVFRELCQRKEVTWPGQ